MPITGLFSCIGFLGLLLLVLAVPASVVLLLGGKRRAALKVLCVPLGMIATSILLSFLVFAAAERHSRAMSARPNYLFVRMFAFEPPPGTQVLNAYYHLGGDSAVTVLKLRTTPDVVEKIMGRRFIRSDRRTCLWSHESGHSNMPEPVLSWFLPPQARSLDWYRTEGFNDTFGRDEAILGYDQETLTAYFYWCGVD